MQWDHWLGSAVCPFPAQNPTQSGQCAAHPEIAHKSQRSLEPSAISVSRRAPGVSAPNIHIIKDAPVLGFASLI